MGVCTKTSPASRAHSQRSARAEGRGPIRRIRDKPRRVFDKLRQARDGLGFDLGNESLKLFLHHLIQRRSPPAASRRRSIFLHASECGRSIALKIGRHGVQVLDRYRRDW